MSGLREATVSRDHTKASPRPLLGFAGHNCLLGKWKYLEIKYFSVHNWDLINRKIVFGCTDHNIS